MLFDQNDFSQKRIYGSSELTGVSELVPMPAAHASASKRGSSSQHRLHFVAASPAPSPDFITIVDRELYSCEPRRQRGASSGHMAEPPFFSAVKAIVDRFHDVQYHRYGKPFVDTWFLSPVGYPVCIVSRAGEFREHSAEWERRILGPWSVLYDAARPYQLHLCTRAIEEGRSDPNHIGHVIVSQSSDPALCPVFVRHVGVRYRMRTVEMLACYVPRIGYRRQLTDVLQHVRFSTGPLPDTICEFAWNYVLVPPDQLVNLQPADVLDIYTNHPVASDDFLRAPVNGVQ